MTGRKWRALPALRLDVALPRPGNELDMTQETLYHEMISWISDKTEEGKTLLKKINKSFEGCENGHQLWFFLTKRYLKLNVDSGGDMVDAKLKAIKVPYGVVPDELERLATEFDETYDEYPIGKRGVDGDKAKAWFSKLKAAGGPFPKWVTELESYDELHREDDEDSLLADFEDVAGRLLRRYSGATSSGTRRRAVMVRRHYPSLRG